jgi:hypothetical protein
MLPKRRELTLRIISIKREADNRSGKSASSPSTLRIFAKRLRKLKERTVATIKFGDFIKKIPLHAVSGSKFI